VNKYKFLLNFGLPNHDADPEAYLDALYEAGCDDAMVGVNLRGLLGLDFVRRAESAEGALQTAVRDVQKAIPGAFLIQAGPDLVNLTDMAVIFDCSRQNMRKYAVGPTASRDAFPVPVIMGEVSLWHLAEIAQWLKKNTNRTPPAEVVEVAKAAAKLNLDVEVRRVQRILETA
jgi:hypothetical protein